MPKAEHNQERVPPHIRQATKAIIFKSGCDGTTLDGACGAKPNHVILFDLRGGASDIPIMACSHEHVEQHVLGTDGCGGGLVDDPDVRNLRVGDAEDWVNRIPRNN